MVSEEKLLERLANEIIAPSRLVSMPSICEIVMKVSPEQYYTSLLLFSSQQPRNYAMMRQYFHKFRNIHDREKEIFHQVTLTNDRLDYILDYVSRELNQ